MEDRDAGAKRDGLADVIDGDVGPSELLGGKAEVEMRLGIVRVGLQSLAVQALRLLRRDPPGEVGDRWARS